VNTDPTSFERAIAAAREDVAGYLTGLATFQVVQDRDMAKDRYVLSFRRIGQPQTELPFPEECALLLPRGADYGRWRGATVFDGIPIELFGTLYISIGMHEVLAHRSRNSYIRMQAFLVEATALEQARAVVESVRQIIRRRLQETCLPEPSGSETGMISPFDPAYAFLILGFFKQWRDSLAVGQPAFMRTLCLSEEMTPLAMARALEPYISKSSIRLLGDRRRHIVNFPQPPSTRPWEQAPEESTAAAAGSGSQRDGESSTASSRGTDSECGSDSHALLGLVRRLMELVAQLWRAYAQQSRKP
jgi:hypothetical protein